jgi:hypothetical protein
MPVTRNINAALVGYNAVAPGATNEYATKADVAGLGTGTVTSVAMTVPTGFTVSGSPVTTAGTLGVTLDTQTANKVLASATSGGAATPAFRALVAADLPAGTGTVTSVAQTVPTEFAIGGSPITTSGTLAITKNTQVANTAWAGPTTGADAQPTFRALVANDLPAGTMSQAQVLTRMAFGGY